MQHEQPTKTITEIMAPKKQAPSSSKMNKSNTTVITQVVSQVRDTFLEAASAKATMYKHRKLDKRNKMNTPRHRRQRSLLREAL